MPSFSVFNTLALDQMVAHLQDIENDSNCKRAKVGCILLNEDMSIGVTASNGSDHPNYCQRPDEEGNCGCLHAEVHAVLALGDMRPTFAIVSRAPCERCAKVLVGAGIKTVYYVDESRPQAEGFVVFDDAGVHYGQIPKRISTAETHPRIA